MNENTYRDVLEAGFTLHWYEIISVLGRGSFGVTYLAWDKNLNQQVAIKEYFPRDYSSRDSGFTVHPSTGESREIFEWGLNRFIREAQTLAQFKHNNIVRVMSVFELNNTAYMVMEYEEGEDLSLLYKREKNLSEQALLDIFIPVLEGLKLVHNAGFTHRDIKPANIYIRNDGSPVLIDFGSARKTTGAATQAITSLVTHGYAPFEQYNESDDKQGAWTDIYALGACLYCAINDKSPLDALTRGSNFISSGRDGYEPLSMINKNSFSQNFLLAIDNALLFQAHDRPQDVLIWADMLRGKMISPALPDNEEATIVRPTPNNESSCDVLGPLSTQPNKHSKNNPYNKPLSSIQIIRKKPKAWAVTLISIILIGVTALLFLDKEEIQHPLVKNDKQQLTSLLKVADTARRAGKLIETKDSAIYLYQNVLKLDADNFEATSRIRDIVEIYTDRIKNDMNAGFYEKAQTNIKWLLAAKMHSIDLIKLEKEVKLAKNNKQKIDSLLQQVKNNLTKRKMQAVEQNIADILSINPDSKKAKTLRASIKSVNQKVSTKLKQAKRAFSLGNLFMPRNKNALALYQAILKLDPRNSKAKEGIKNIKQYSKHQFDKNIKSGNVKVAEKIILSVEKHMPNTALAKNIRKIFNDKKIKSKQALAKINELIAYFKKTLESRDMMAVSKISQFKPGRKSFLQQFYENYRAFKVKASEIKYIDSENKGSVNIALFDLVNSYGNNVSPGKWGKFKVVAQKNSQGHWKVAW